MKLKDVDDIEKGEAMKVSIVRHNPADAMLTHKDRSVCVMKEVPRQQGKLANDLLSNIGVALCRNKHIQSWRREQDRDKTPGFRVAPWPPHDARMCSNPQEFIQNRPSDVPRIHRTSLVVQPVVGLRVKWRIRISGVNENVGVNQDHKLSAFHSLIQTLTVRNINQSSAAMKRRQRSELRAFSLRTEKATERRLYQLRHSSSLASGFALQLSHHCVVNP